MPKISYTYKVISGISDFLQAKTKVRPLIGVICGSGIDLRGKHLNICDEFDYRKIPNFPLSTVQGHAGKLIFGFINEVPVVILTGRFHYYEGYSQRTCTMTVRTAKMLGIKYLILTNAAGAVNRKYKVGDIMLIKDHISFPSLAGISPLRGPNEERLGVRFPALTSAYTPKLLKIAKKVAKDICIEDKLRVGVYGCQAGPCYESVAEMKMMKTLGIDAVGMSTTNEVQVAAHSRLKVLAFSLITNIGLMDYDSKNLANHQEVIDAANAAKVYCAKLVQNVIKEISKLDKKDKKC